MITFMVYGRNKVAMITFFVVNLYIVSAWDIWWYGGTGGRAMIQSYPVLFFFVASLLQFLSRRPIAKWIFSPVIVLCVYFNLWFFVQSTSANGLYDSQAMNKQYYWATVLRWHVNKDVFKLKDTDEIYTGVPKQSKLLYTNNFEADTFVYDASLPPIEGKRSAILSLDRPYSPPASFAYSGGAPWLRVQATVACKNSEWIDWKMVQFVVRFMSKGQIVKEKMIRVNRFLTHKDQKDVYIDVKTPDTAFDTVSIFFWNPATEHYIIADNIKA